MTIRKFKSEGLVRDKRVPQMEKSGATVYYEVLSDQLYIHELKKKIIEEATEAARAVKKEEMAEELADVMEVLFALGAACGISRLEIESARAAKENKLGGFCRKIKMHSISMPDGHPGIEYYLARPEKYPEMK